MAEKIRLRLLTPTKKLFDDEVDMVVIRGEDGEIAFLHNHQPIVTVLGYGVMRIYNSGEEITFSVLGGFAEVNDNVVTVLSDAAEKPNEIDRERVLEAKARAERIIKEQANLLDVKRAELSLRRAFVRIEASSYSILGGKKSK